ncbi:hypothetical protein AAF712_015757 [Marasmius tenuissimus]|uniref:BZIP domain-containing protein n=1 Tax=Marasmius tenuissimus TaxID=585030 RepID=A0ABR2Z9C6_9AGAR
MPAHRLHKTKKDREKATQEKNRRYYEKNKEVIRTNRRVKYAKEMNVERRELKAENEEKKRSSWETRAQEEYHSNTLEKLRDLEASINTYLFNSGSAYFERIFQEYLAWSESTLQHEPSPLELLSKVFSSMLDTVAKIGNGILNEYGAWKEWKECQRPTRRIRCLIRCADNLEEIVLEWGSSVLALRHSKGLLAFQEDINRRWLDRLSSCTYIALLDKD